MSGEPVEVRDEGRMAVVSDPEGAVFRLWEAKAHLGAQLVNDPGTWNFSLNTRVLDGATAQGAVFAVSRYSPGG